MIPETIEIHLMSLRAPENVDRRSHIGQLLRQILFSEEVTPSANDQGEWVMDAEWDAVIDAVTMKRVARVPHRR
jgi:hypothetical protein